MYLHYELILPDSPPSLSKHVLQVLRALPRNLWTTLWTTLCITYSYLVKNKRILSGYAVKILWNPWRILLLSWFLLPLTLLLLLFLLTSTHSPLLSPPSFLNSVDSFSSPDSVSLPMRRYVADNPRVHLREGSPERIPLHVKQGEKTSAVLLQALSQLFPSEDSIDSSVLDRLESAFPPPSPNFARSLGDRRLVLSVLSSSAPMSFSLTEEGRRRLIATKQKADWSVETQTFPVHTAYDLVSSTIEKNFYLTAQEKKISLSIFRKFLDVMSFDVDFQRDIWRGASFHILTRKEVSANGSVLSGPDLVAASLYTGRKTFAYYRASYNGAFYDQEGNSARRSLRRTPISGLRVSSRFGKRRHPVLGFTRMHEGVDFAAPYGTPILAAGEGVIKKVARNGSYGRYVVIRHNDRLSTLYAHMRHFSRGMRRGVRVDQGQTIGYTGTSGLSTGPHLHYEIHRDGRPVDPRRVRLPTLPPLEARYAEPFHKLRIEYDRLLAGETIAPPPTAIYQLSRLGCSALAVLGLCENNLQNPQEASIVSSL